MVKVCATCIHGGRIIANTVKHKNSKGEIRHKRQTMITCNHKNKAVPIDDTCKVWKKEMVR